MQLGGDNAREEIAREEIIGRLNRRQPSVASKYFYDVMGSRLFELITQLPEYYLTRTEQALLAANAESIARVTGRGGCLVDLGAGNCSKARTLLPALQSRHYVAVDISPALVKQSLPALQASFPATAMHVVTADLSDDLVLPAAIMLESRVFLYAGSSIGNFDKSEALALLGSIRRLCSPGGGLLISVDLIKEETVLEAAYTDGLGITAAFNLNVLNHINTLIASNFKIRDWKHRASYNRLRSRIEMHLEAVDNTFVSWPGGGRYFAKGESIHTECSYKFRVDEFNRLLTEAGFSSIREWTDERQWVALFYASA